MRRLTLLLVLVLAAVGLWSIAQRGRARPAAAAPGAARSRAVAPTVRRPQVPIQDGKTIDFSSGRPVVKAGAAETAAIDRAVKDMDAAADSVTFAPKSNGTGTTAK